MIFSNAAPTIKTRKKTRKVIDALIVNITFFVSFIYV